MGSYWLRAALAAAGLLLAGASVAGAADGPPPARFKLKSAPVVEAVPLEAGPFRMQSRFSAQDSAGSLHEGGRFSLIGRMAKAGVDCGADTLFKDGFEGP